MLCTIDFIDVLMFSQLQIDTRSVVTSFRRLCVPARDIVPSNALAPLPSGKGCDRPGRKQGSYKPQAEI
jgi:hypothetical protein